MMGEPVDGADGKVAVCHPFTEIDIAWILAYTADDPVPVMVCEDGLPADFFPPPPIVDDPLEDGQYR